MKETNTSKSVKDTAAKKMYETPSGKVTLINTKDVIYESAAKLRATNEKTLGFGGADWWEE